MLMTSPRSLAPCSLAHLRASLMAVSLASAPELPKNTRSAKECSQRSWASCACWGMWKIFDTWRRVAACSRSVPTTLGWLWPRAVTEMPPVKSRYILPSESHKRQPVALVRGEGHEVLVRQLEHALRVHESPPLRACRRLENDLRTDAFLGEHLEQDGVRPTPVDDVGLLRPARERAQ